METYKALIHQLYEEVFTGGKLELIEHLFAENFIDHSTPNQQVGRQGVIAYVRAVRTGFPDLEISIDDLVVEGNTLAVRTSWRGTHLGVYEGMQPSGQQAHRTLMQFFHIADKVLTEEWNEGEGLLTSVQRDSQ